VIHAGVVKLLQLVAQVFELKNEGESSMVVSDSLQTFMFVLVFSVQC